MQRKSSAVLSEAARDRCRRPPTAVGTHRRVRGPNIVLDLHSGIQLAPSKFTCSSRLQPSSDRRRRASEAFIASLL